MRLTTAGTPLGLDDAIVGAVSRSVRPNGSRAVLVARLQELAPRDCIDYRAIVTQSGRAEAESLHSQAGVPIIYSVRDVDHLRDGDVVVLQPSTGFIRTLYRPDSVHNALFLTERCNSNCLMCSQPPKDRDDISHFVKTNLELVSMIDPATEYLGITGGEPTLLGNHLFSILAALRDSLPATSVHMLTNGRMFAWEAMAGGLAAVGHPNLMLGIPLYADDAILHDYIVQAKDAFDQTVLGLHRLARHRQAVEIRVVLHRLTIPRLVRLAEYIYRNLPFVRHIALMGLEPTGYTPRNRGLLWIDPAEYQDQLEQAVELLTVRGMSVSIYNSQLCVLRNSLWKFARKSISDWKNIYLSECQNCAQIERCGGLFQSAERMHSAHIHSLAATC